jgi:hypothetical protein
VIGAKVSLVEQSATSQPIKFSLPSWEGKIFSNQYSLKITKNFPYLYLPKKGVQISQFDQFLLLGPAVANFLTLFN